MLLILPLALLGNGRKCKRWLFHWRNCRYFWDSPWVVSMTILLTIQVAGPFWTRAYAVKCVSGRWGNCPEFLDDGNCKSSPSGETFPSNTRPTLDEELIFCSVLNICKWSDHMFSILCPFIFASACLDCSPSCGHLMVFHLTYQRLYLRGRDI